MTGEKTWVLATHNTGKIKEITQLLASFGVKIQGAAEKGLPEPDETEPTFAGNAALKARAAMQATGLPALADDSGLIVTALEDRPGIHSARWAGEPRDFDRAMARVHAEWLKTGKTDQGAAFVCTLALARPDGSISFHEGRVDGQFVWPPRGEGGFGYDPIFVPEGETRTFGEMTSDEKKAHSHRARAFDRLVASEFST